MVVYYLFYYQNGNMSIKHMEIILGKRLKELRTEKGMTQKEAAKAFGLNAVTYLHYEKDQREPPLKLLAEFAQFYGVTVDYLIGVSDI